MAELKFFPCFYFFAKTFPFENIIGRTAPGNQQVFIVEKENSSFKDFSCCLCVRTRLQM